MKFNPFGRVLILIAGLLAVCGPVLAQESSDEAEAEAPKIRVLPPAYEAEMLRLSEVLGALHYLRELCGAEEGQTWREQMQLLIEKEEPTQERRAQMIAHFNNGFRGFRETYRECTPAAVEANNRYVAEGAKLAIEIPSRFGR